MKYKPCVDYLKAVLIVSVGTLGIMMSICGLYKLSTTSDPNVTTVRSCNCTQSQ